MRSKLVTLVAVTASLAFASVASAQTSDSATATATASIVAPISIARVTNLNFGSLVTDTAATTATVAANAAGTYSGSATQLGSTTSASFTVTGHTGATFSVVTAPNTVSLVGPAGSTAMSAVLDRGCASGTCTLVGGTDTVFVGGTLSIGASQMAGTYTSAAFDVTVAYN